MDKDTITEEDTNMISYFWEEKGDLERWSDWKKRKPVLEKERPEIVKAWNDYKTSIRTLNAVVRSLEC